MHLEKLEIHGFKSFAQKVVLHFPLVSKHSKGVTAVVGPNGSGKSNIADAIRWALGEQSTKQLRGKKSEDIIFFGSQIKSRLGYAEVTLYFNNEDGTFPLDYLEVSITRRLYRDGQSQYLLNNNPAKLSDIVLLLAQAHVGQKNYSVIGQGMIDTIINATPADRKDFFYEAAGVRAYQIKKDQSISKLSQTEINVSQVSLQLAELEPKLKYLKRQMSRLSQREQWEKEYADIARQFYNHQWNVLNGNLEKLHTDENKFKKQIDEIQKKLSALQHSFDLLENESISSSTQSDEFELTKKLNDLYRQQRELLSQIALIDGRLELALEKKGQAHISWISRRIDDVKILQQDLLIQKEMIATEKETLKNTIERVSKNKEALDQNRKEKESSLSPLNVDTLLNETKNDVQVLLSTKSDFKKEAETLERLISFIQKLYEKIDVIHGRFSLFVKVPASKANTHTDIKLLENEFSKVVASLEKARAQFQVSNERLENIKSQEVTAHRELEKLQSELVYYGSDDKKERDTALNNEKEKIQNFIILINKEIKEIENKLVNVRTTEQSSRNEVFTLQKEIQVVQEQLREQEQLFSQNQIECARYSAHRDDLLEKLCEDLAIAPDTRIELRTKIESVVSVLGFKKDFKLTDEMDISRSMYLLKNKLAQLGMIDKEDAGEYEETKNTVEFLQNQLDDLAKARVYLEEAIKELDVTIKTRFESSMKHINHSFNEYFKEVFRGGSAKLILHKDKSIIGKQEEAENTIPFQDSIAGVEIEATPPGKKIKSVSFLSGGEKALAAIALICAIMDHNPSPFVVLDEVDAALDEPNAHRFSYILTQLSHKTQFIVITHNRVTMHIAQRLYGVMMGNEGVSSVVSLDIDGVSDILTK